MYEPWSLGLLSDLQPLDACKLLDHLFGDKEDAELAKIKQCSADVLLAAATASKGRCALTQSAGSFKNLPDSSVVKTRIAHDRLSFDRIVPECEGGQYVMGNIQVLKYYVNTAKRATTQAVLKLWIARMTKLGAKRLKKNLMASIRRAEARQGP
ncbi:hypothetical protein BC940DRAFT_320272 [Gongronella butleri]|nr:hypothetical protein BC940DRAFT_320272 [Gongronella butleri]